MGAATPRSLLACLVVVLSSCTTAPARSSDASAPASAPPTVAATSLSAPLAAGPSSPCDAPVGHGRAAAPSSQVAVLVDVCDLGTRDGPHSTALRAYPVELPFLSPLPGVRPISFQHHFKHALSPDGRTLAVILWPSGSGNAGGRLHLIDVPSWTVTARGVEIDAAVNQIEYAPDGSALYWLKPTTFDSAHGMPRKYALYRYDVRAQTVSELLHLPAAFMPFEHRIVGDRLAIYGVPTSTQNVAERAPEVHMVDLVRSNVAASTTLTGIRAGQVKVETDPDRYPFLYLRPGIAWDLPRQRLFVVDAEADRVLVVDLTTGAVRGPLSFVPRKSSLLEDLLRWFFPVADAKMVAETARRAVVSPDGARLYVQGLRSDFVKRDGTWKEVITPLGLRVVETASMTETVRIDDTVEELGLSDDGNLLAYVTFRAEDSGQEWAKRTAYRLHVIDAMTMKPTAIAELADRGRLVAIAPDGGAAYLTSIGAGPRVRAVSTSTGHLLAEVGGSEYFVDLIPLWRSPGR